MSRAGARISQVRMCARCHLLEAHNCAYCDGCRRIKSRERYARNLASQGDRPLKTARKRPVANSCNCGNPLCNGLACERLVM